MRLLTHLFLFIALASSAFAQSAAYSTWEFLEDFHGGGTFATSAGAFDPWKIDDTSSGGTPTYVRVDLSESTGTYANGVAKLTMSGDTEVQNVCLSFGNKLCWDWQSVYGFECRLRFVAQTGSAKDSNTQLAFGLVSDRADDPDSTTAHALFRLAAASTSMAVTCETDDGTTNVDDIATTLTMTDATWYRFRILLTNKSSVKFYANSGTSSPNLLRLASAQTFDADQYGGAVQPMLQIWKASDSNTDSVEVDYIQVYGSR